MASNGRAVGTGGAERITDERLYALLYQLSDRVRDVDLQVRALGRRLDEWKKEENGGRK